MFYIVEFNPLYLTVKSNSLNAVILVGNEMATIVLNIKKKHFYK